MLGSSFLVKSPNETNLPAKMFHDGDSGGALIGEINGQRFQLGVTSFVFNSGAGRYQNLLASVFLGRSLCPLLNNYKKNIGPSYLHGYEECEQLTDTSFGREIKTNHISY